MSKFVKVESLQYGSGKNETIIGDQWINLDYVISYHPPTKGLFFSDAERMTLTEQGEKILIEAISKGQS